MKGAKKGAFWGLVIIVLAVMFLAGRFETSEKVKGKVLWQDRFVVVIEDENGQVWKWNTEKEFRVNEKVVVVVNNKGTLNNKKDDEVRKVVKKKC